MDSFLYGMFISREPSATAEQRVRVDAVFAPIFRYFDVFDQISDSHIFDKTPKVRAWRRALSERPSVRHAVVPEYPQHLRAFLQKHEAHLLTLAGRA